MEGLFRSPHLLHARLTRIQHATSSSIAFPPQLAIRTLCVRISCLESACKGPSVIHSGPLYFVPRTAFSIRDFFPEFSDDTVLQLDRDQRTIFSCTSVDLPNLRGGHSQTDQINDPFAPPPLKLEPGDIATG